MNARKIARARCSRRSGPRPPPRRRRRPAAPSAARSASAAAASEIAESISSIAIEPSLSTSQLAQVGDDHARVLAGDVAEDHVAVGLSRGALEEDQVADRWRVLEQVEHVARTGSRGTTIRRWTIARKTLPSGAPVLTDYHVHLRPDDPDATAERYFTAENVDRYLEAAARGRDRGARRLRARPPLHRRARDLGPPVLARERARRPRRLLRVRTHDAAAARDRDGLRARAARTGSPTCSTRTTSTTSSARSTSSATGRSTTPSYDVWSTDGDPDQLWRRYFETLAEAARSGLYDILAHPDLVKYWGDERPAPAARPALLLRARRSRRSPRPGSRSRSRPPGCASRSPSSIPSDALRRDAASTPARSSRSPPTPTSPRTSAATTRPRSRRCAAGASARSRVFEGRERRMEPLG